MMPSDVIITRETAPLPKRSEDAHKGDVGRVIIMGGCWTDVVMAGAPALATNAAFRTGSGLVQMLVPEELRTSVAVLAPCATTRTLPTDVDGLLDAVSEFRADVVALGPGLGRSLTAEVVADFINRLSNPMVVDADGLNLLAAAPAFKISDAQRVVMTPHPGELRRLLAARNVDRLVDDTTTARRAAACALVEAYGGIAVLKGRSTIVTDGERLYVNETGNAGMATGGAGDVLTGVIAALIGQQLAPFEAAILGVYLHGLAGDFAAEELGRLSMTAMDIIEYLPEAFSEYEMSTAE
jgi:NAD(P)H-hydrate epimerase